MRIALLSAVEPLTGEALSPRGLTRIGGRTILQSQLEFALAAGCERVACLSPDLPSELIALQHLAERNGAQFQCVRNSRGLSGVVDAADELLVIADGAVFPSSAALELLDGGRMIGTFPAGIGVPAGFERIDRDASWCGVMLIGGGLVERMTALPEDIDPMSSLLRMALQSGVKVRHVEPALVAQGDWVIIDNADAALIYSERWLGSVTRKSSLAAPTHLAADIAALTVLKRHTDPARAAMAIMGVSYGLLLVVIVAGYFDHTLGGFAAILGSVFGFRFSETALQVIGNSGGARNVQRMWSKIHAFLVDFALVGTTALSVSSLKFAGAFFSILILMGLVRLAELRRDPQNWPWLADGLTDRGTIALFCLITSVAGFLVPALQIFALLFLSLELLRLSRVKLT